MFKNITYTPQTSFTPYPAEVLPDEFNYPNGYLKLAKSVDHPRFFYGDSSIMKNAVR